MDAPNIRVADANGYPVPLPLAQLKDPVEFSNACRAFYNARVEATERMKERVRKGDYGVGTSEKINISNSIIGSPDEINRNGSNSDSGSSSSCIINTNNEGGNRNTTCSGKNSTGAMLGSFDTDQQDGSVTSCVNNGVQARARRRSNKGRSAMDASMDVLRREMAGLMELDLRLMKQLLILNEEIEDLKWRRRNAWVDNCAWSQDGSCDMMQSAASLSNRIEMQPTLKFSTPSSLSLQLEGDENVRFSVYDDDDHTNTFNRGKGREKTTKKTVSSAVGEASTSSDPSAETNLVLRQDEVQQDDEESPARVTVSAVSENFRIMDAQNIKPLESCGGEINGQAIEPDDTSTDIVQSQSKLDHNQISQRKDSLPASMTCKNAKQIRKSRSLLQSEAFTNLKTPNGCFQKRISAPNNPENYRKVEPKTDSKESSTIKSNNSKTNSVPLSSNRNNSVRAFQSGAKSDSRKMQIPRTTEKSDTANPSEGCCSSMNNFALASAVGTPKHAGKMVATHKFDCSHTHPVANHQIPSPGHHSPGPGHRKRHRNKVTTPISVRNISLGSGVRQPRRKTKGPNKVVKGDTESHDSGINDIFN